LLIWQSHLVRQFFDIRTGARFGGSQGDLNRAASVKKSKISIEDWKEHYL